MYILHIWLSGTITILCRLTTAYKYDVYYLIISNELFLSIYYDIPCISFIRFDDYIIALYLFRKNVIF